MCVCVSAYVCVSVCVCVCACVCMHVCISGCVSVLGGMGSPLGSVMYPVITWKPTSTYIHITHRKYQYELTSTCTNYMYIYLTDKIAKERVGLSIMIT